MHRHGLHLHVLLTRTAEPGSARWACGADASSMYRQACMMVHPAWLCLCRALRVQPSGLYLASMTVQDCAKRWGRPAPLARLEHAVLAEALRWVAQQADHVAACPHAMGGGMQQCASA